MMNKYIFILGHKDDIQMYVRLEEGKGFDKILSYDSFSTIANYIISVASLLEIQDIYMSNSGSLVGIYDYVCNHEEAKSFNWYDTYGCDSLGSAEAKGPIDFELMKQGFYAHPSKKNKDDTVAIYANDTPLFKLKDVKVELSSEKSSVEATTRTPDGKLEKITIATPNLNNNTITITGKLII